VRGGSCGGAGGLPLDEPPGLDAERLNGSTGKSYKPRSIHRVHRLVARNSQSILPPGGGCSPSPGKIGRKSKLFDLIGAGYRIRTCDPVITNHVLYQLS
jgi:hypothetical protein